MTPEFVGFQSIPRLFRDCTVTEKIDGTNAIIHISDDGQTVTAGSRSRWLTPEHDNCGFYKWVEANKEDLKSLGPGYHYGEWWGSGIQRRYGLAEKRFSLFNIHRWGENGKDVDKKPKCCYTVPVIYQGPFDLERIKVLGDELKNKGSVAAPGFMNPEGLVVRHDAGKYIFKYTLDGDGHKFEKQKNKRD